MNEFVIEINGLRKTFKDRAAVNGLNLKVPAGSIFGFLGRNGAGKTTTIKLLMVKTRCRNSPHVWAARFRSQGVDRSPPTHWLRY
jgi:ABC-type multidrug transport system ATPase subunit